MRELKICAWREGGLTLRRLIITIITLIAAAAMMLTPTVAFASFPDIPLNAAYRNAVDFLVSDGTLTGYSDGTFRPDAGITRAEFSTVLSRAMRLDTDFSSASLKSIPFSDIDSSNWAAPYIYACYENGYIDGMGDGTFRPSQNVTLEQAVKMIVCAANISVDSESGSGKWYDKYISAANRNELLTNVTSSTGTAISRGNVAQIVYNTEKSVSSESASEAVSTPTPVPTVEATPTPEPTPTPTVAPAAKPEVKPTAAATASATPKPTYAPKNPNLIVLDAGHNYSGADTGASSPDGTVKEQIATWRIASKVKERLESSGYSVILTRPSETSNIANTSVNDSLQARCDVANTNGAGLFVSIHCNAGGGTGTEVYYYDGNESGESLAKLIAKKISESTTLRNRGAKSTTGLYVIKGTLSTSVLVETAFIDAAEDYPDVNLLSTSDGQTKIANAIADAIIEYKQKN